MKKTPDWVVRCVDTFKACSSAQYPSELWRYAERSLNDLVSDRAGRAWVKLDTRLANHNRLGRENFVMQVCNLAASSMTVPHTAPATAKRMATAAKRAITQLGDILPRVLPTATQFYNAADMRLASARATLPIDRRFFEWHMFRAMLTGLQSDIDAWETDSSRLAKPDHPTASRLIFVRDLTVLMHDYFASPLRSIVAELASAAHSYAGDLDAAAVAKLAPLNKKAKAVRSHNAPKRAVSPD